MIPAGAGLVLAAGDSRRMGTPKQLLDVDGVPAVVRAARAFADIGVTPLVVVAGAAGEVAAAVRGAGFTVAVNEAPERGMYSSVSTGLRALGREPEWVGILPADCCLVRAESIGRLVREKAATKAVAVRPVLGDRHGHPLVADRRLLAALPEDGPPGGLRHALDQAGVHIADIAVDDEGAVLDMDRPSDYERVLALAPRERVPTAAECARLWDVAGTPAPVREHSDVVRRVSRALGEALAGGGVPLHLRLLEAAALLHDVSRADREPASAGVVGAAARTGHAADGAAWLDRQGLPRVAAVAGRHTDLGEWRPPPDEAALLYLADRLVSGATVVSLDRRLRDALARFAGDEAAVAAARRRLAVARRIADAFARATGTPAEQVAGTNDP